MLPANSDEIVLDSKCEHTDSSTFKEHLKFTFIPSMLSRLAFIRCILKALFERSGSILADKQFQGLSGVVILAACHEQFHVALGGV